jgi:hypothetical protein
MNIDPRKTSISDAATLVMARHKSKATEICSNRADRTEDPVRHEFWMAVWVHIEARWDSSILKDALERKANGGKLRSRADDLAEFDRRNWEAEDAYRLQKEAAQARQHVEAVTAVEELRSRLEER